MIQRCTNPNTENYSRYGGRGIKVCDEWSRSYIAFAAWARQNGYRPGLSIDRVNNDGDYAPENCCWSTARVQANNRRDNHVVEAFGESKTLAEWARDSRAVVKASTIQNRIAVHGWSAEDAITKVPDIGRLRRGRLERQ